MTLTRTDTPHPDDTIVAVSSAPGPGLRAIVRISGPNTRAVIDAVFTPRSAPQTPRRGYTLPGSIQLSGVHSPLPADLYFFPDPHSYTGQDLAEEPLAPRGAEQLKRDHAELLHEAGGGEEHVAQVARPRRGRQRATAPAMPVGSVSTSVTSTTPSSICQYTV